MKRELRPALQVIEFASRLAPEPRRAVKHALAELRFEKGDIRALEGKLAGYYRLRIGRHRLIFGYASDGAIEAVFLEDRSIVYEIFESEFVSKLKGR